MQARYYVFGLCKYLAWISSLVKCMFPRGLLAEGGGGREYDHCQAFSSGHMDVALAE